MDYQKMTIKSVWKNLIGQSNLATQQVNNYTCWCYNCLNKITDENGWKKTYTTFIVCPDCGNKRCPKSTDHNLACTGSNNPGQPGSRYE